MSGYYYPPNDPSSNEEDFDFNQPYQTSPTSSHESYPSYTAQPIVPVIPSQQYYTNPQQLYYQPQQYQQPFNYQAPQQQPWMTPTVPSNYPAQGYPAQPTSGFPSDPQMPAYAPQVPTAGPSTGYLSPNEAVRSRPSRSASFASNASSAQSYSESDVSRSVSPNASEMLKWGFRNENGSWSCAYPGCSSRSTFNRGCDLRKHYKRHTKSLFCRHEGCPQATEGGFSSKKDRARHEAKHNPNIVCEWEGCDRLFSRVDNMVSSMCCTRLS